MQDSNGRWMRLAGDFESSDTGAGLRIYTGRTDSGRERFTTVYRGVIFHCYGRKDYFAQEIAGRYVELHRYVWQCEVGEIPDGHHIHHRDDNTHNNDLANLQCLLAGDHLRHHQKRFRKPRLRDAVCVECGGAYRTPQPGRARTCSKVCANRWQLKQGHKHIYHRVCPVCGSSFARQSSKAIYCSLACAGTVIQKHRKLAQKACGQCRVMFQPATSKQLFCCRRCAIISVHAARKNASLQPGG